MVPFPIPAPMAITIHPIEYSVSVGVKANNNPATVNPANTHINILKELNLSPNHPPTGLKNVAIAIKPAVLNPASTLSNPKCPTKKFGK